MRKWRRQLHFWDPKPEEDEIKIEVRSWKLSHSTQAAFYHICQPADTVSFIAYSNHPPTRPPLFDLALYSKWPRLVEAI